MPNPTPAAQVAALAELFGITPDTHRHLRVLNQHCTTCGKKEGFTFGETRYFLGKNARKEHRQNDSDSWCGPVSEEWTLNLPDPLGPDADGVWLAPAMAYCAKHCDGFIEEWISNINTAWILERLLAARVPEIVRAMEEVA